jgi:hypothetical protein
MSRSSNCAFEGLSVERFAHGLGILLDHTQIRNHGAVRMPDVLLPISQCAQGDVKLTRRIPLESSSSRAESFSGSVSVAFSRVARVRLTNEAASSESSLISAMLNR